MPPKSPTTPKDAGQTEKFLLCVTPELKKRVKQEAYKMFGKRKGAESFWVEQTLRAVLGIKTDGVVER
jgi:hypothetical protein